MRLQVHVSCNLTYTLLAQPDTVELCCHAAAHIHLTKFPTLPVIFSVYLKTDYSDFFENLHLSRTMIYQNRYESLMESKNDISRYNISIILCKISKVTKIVNTKRDLHCTHKDFVFFLHPSKKISVMSGQNHRHS